MRFESGKKSSPEIKLLSALLFGNRPRTLRDHTAQIQSICTLLLVCVKLNINIILYGR